MSGFDPDNGGAVGRFLRWAFGRSWRTTLLGWAAIASTIVSAAAATQDAPGPLVKWAPIVGQAITAFGVMLTKDAKVSGADRPPDVLEAPAPPSSSTT